MPTGNTVQAADNRAPILAARGLRLAHGRKVVVSDLSLDVRYGECVALIGANGAGKSTTLMALAGIHPLGGGEIVIDDSAVTRWSHRTSIEAGFVICPEGRHLFPGMSVIDNLRLGALGRGRVRTGVAERLEQVESIFPILRSRRTQLAGTLSGGEQQMVAIARALMSNPKLLILDEPCLGLAPMLVERVFEIIRDIADTRCAVVLAEQNVEGTLQIADRVYVLEAGAVIAQGTSREISKNPRLTEAFLGQPDLITEAQPANVSTKAEGARDGCTANN